MNASSEANWMLSNLDDVCFQVSSNTDTNAGKGI